MGWFDFLGKKVTNYERVGGTVVIEVPAKLYYKELAIYTASSLIENAISKCEFKTYINHTFAKNEDYFLLNIAPNRNENSSLFWHKVVRRMIRSPEGALVIEHRNKLYCAESFDVKEVRPILGNLYDNVVLEGGVTFKGVFRADDVYLFKMEDVNVRQLIDGMYEDYGKLYESAARTFKDTNGRKFKFKVSGAKQGDDEFNEEFANTISKQIKAYMENEYATYVEYEGEELEEQKNTVAKSTDDIISLRKDMFEMVGQAFKIPQSLMTGSVTAVKDVMDIFLTLAVDPFADAISETLNKRARVENYLAGNYYEVDTGKIRHRDIFDLADNIEKLIGSSVMNPDEVRKELNLSELGTEWSSRYYMTKNIAKAEDVANGLTEGGEQNGKSTED